MLYHTTCRACRTDEELLEVDEHDGRVWSTLSCDHWQENPEPGEFVLANADGLEAWGAFDPGTVDP